jgi:hypothetical protein
MTPPLTEDATTRASLELLYDISRELSSALDFRTVLRRVLLRSMACVGAINGTISNHYRGANPGQHHPALTIYFGAWAGGLGSPQSSGSPGDGYEPG